MISFLFLLLNCCGSIASVSAWTVTRPTEGLPTSNWEIAHHRRDSNSRSSWFPLNLYVDTTDDLARCVFPAPPRYHHHDNSMSHPSVPAAALSHGMPWKSSICSDYVGDNLYYMPFWEYQMQFMKQHLTNLRGMPCTSSTGQDMSYVQNSQGRQRMHTGTFTSDEYRLIRMTVLDAGHCAQVFTSVWYPHDQRLPVLGIDLLQFNHAKKHLCIVDFQPLSDACDFAPLLEPVRQQYPTLQGEMTDRFYNSRDSYFSDHMLLGRHDDRVEEFTADSMVYGDLFPAYQQYLRAHVGLVKEQSTVASTLSSAERVDHHTNHRNYDQYSAERDPAHALLARAFGQEWADEYVYDILFPLAEPPTPVHG